MKNAYRHLLAILWLTLAIGNAAAQNFAGPDTVILRPVGVDIPTLRIGSVALNDAKYCYTWRCLTNETFSYTSTESSLEVYLPDKINTFRGTRVTEIGVQEDDVTIVVEDSVLIVSVTPKRGCYGGNEPISREEFDIVTYPEGYGHLAGYIPLVTPMEEGDLDIDFILEYDGHSDMETATVPVFIDEGDESGLGDDGGYHTVPILSFFSFLEKINNAITAMDALMDIKKTIDKLPIPDNSKPFDFNLTTNFGMPKTKITKECCNSVPIVNEQTQIDLYACASGSFRWRFGPWWGCYLGVMGAVEFTASVEHAYIKLSEEANPCNSPSCPITVGLDLRIGGEVDLLDPSVLSFEVYGFGNVSHTWDALSVSETTTHQLPKIPYKLGFGLDINAIDFYNYRHRYVLKEGVLFD